MKLIAEQVKYLRQKKKELEGRREEYRRYCQARETDNMEGFNGPHFVDIQEDVNYGFSATQLREIDRQLEKAEFVTDRNFDMIDIGTGFVVDFGDGEKDKTMLVEENTTLSLDDHFVSTASDFGQAVLGKKPGDQVEYVVKANGRKISLTIESIDNVKSHYANFIREKALYDRMSKVARKDLADLKENDPAEYARRNMITPSQEALLRNEITRFGGRRLSEEQNRRRNAVLRLLKTAQITPMPTGDTIQVGSTVDLSLVDENNEVKDMHFEFINHAVSTEIEDEYVERVSPLGIAINGLRKGDKFIVRRKNQPALRGVVTGVENYNAKERVM